MRIRGKLVKLWAYLGIAVSVGVVVFLFAFVFIKGAGTVSWEFLTEAPKGAVLGEEGGIFPAIIGSLFFTVTALVIGGIPAVATAIYLVFYCTSKRISGFIRLTVQCISGIPSIVLGLFAYSLLVKTLGLGRCVLSSGVALGIMVLPFIEVRCEKSFLEVPYELVAASCNMGCSKSYTVVHAVLPMCKGELVSALILGGCYAMGATAPMIFTGAVAFAAVPKSILEPAMALPLHLYLLVAQGHTSLPTAYGTAFVMMVLILLSNILATMYGARSKR